MKKLYVTCTNHMDLVFRRSFEEHSIYQDYVIRPYSEIEEAQFNQWFKLMKEIPLVYSVEQSISLKKYLERNPDRFGEVKSHIENGHLELMGGGESVIDYNLVHGEAIIRNHLYSILWYLENFGTRPRNAITPDSFGLSAQLPQIFKGFGYSLLHSYSRVFKDVKPFWKGLNGSCILILNNNLEESGLFHIIRGDDIKYINCSNCKGEGCLVCSYTGMDYSHKCFSPGKMPEECIRLIRDSDCESFHLFLESEEAVVHEDLFVKLETLGRLYSVEIEYTSFDNLYRKFAVELLKEAEHGNVDPEQTDMRREGNPVGTGCYMTRIELKQMNRKLEDLLLSCEKFASIASDYGMNYPAKKLGSLWNQLSQYQFHDSITASHTDYACREIKKIGRNIQLGAIQIYTEAMSIIENNIIIKEIENYQPMLLFNPLNWEVKDQIYQVHINVDDAQKKECLKLIDCNSNPLDILEIHEYKQQENKVLKVIFKGVSIPSVGFTTIYYSFNKSVNNVEISSTIVNEPDTIENEYYVVGYDKKGVTEIFNKELEEIILTGNTGSLKIEEDYGSPWETLARPIFSESINDPFFLENEKQRNYSVSVKKIENCLKKVIVIEGHYTYPERNIQQIDWKQHVTLYNNVNGIYFSTEVYWKTENSRLSVIFPLSFKTKDDEASYEIPYGTIKRSAYEPVYGTHMFPNGDWPQLNFTSCYNSQKDYSVSLINKGLPAVRVKDGIIHLGLLRSPCIPVYIYDFDETKNEGQHTFEYMIVSGKKGLKENKIVQKGIEYNTQFLSCNGNIKSGLLNSEHSFINNKNSNIIITSIKNAEREDAKIIRAYEAFGEKATDRITFKGYNNIYSTDLLEESNERIDDISFNGFEIKTLKVKRRGS